MKTINISNSLSECSRIILGCMRINNKNIDEAEHLIMYAYDRGINYFDHADIYADGYCEELFGKVIVKHKDIRDKIYIQSKCGIVHNEKGRNVAFDFSEKHIIESAESSLKRLGVDYLDALLLHRPDTLVEPEEVASAFDKLYTSGKVRNFGVSNQNPYQIELLKTYVKQPLIINQLQLSIVECGMITQGINTNMKNELSYMHDASILDYTRINNMILQAWSPFQAGFFEGSFIDNPKYQTLNNKLEKYADKYGVEKTAIAASWILRHPVKSQVICGTTNTKHLEAILGCEKVELSRLEWYDIYLAAGHILP